MPDFYDFCPVIFTFSDTCFRPIFQASVTLTTLGSQSFTVSRGPTSDRIVLFVQRCAARPRSRPKAARPRREPHPAVRTRGFPSWVRIRARARARVRIGARVRG